MRTVSFPASTALSSALPMVPQPTIPMDFDTIDITAPNSRDESYLYNYNRRLSRLAQILVRKIGCGFAALGPS
jgi:hypothetical protein